MGESDRRLEAELLAIAERAGPGRTARLAVRHWGWDGLGGATLETTGHELGGLTRERVRQICARLSRRLGEASPPAAALDRALALVARTVPATTQGLARRLADERISERPFHPNGLLTAAAVLGREPGFRLIGVRDVRMAAPDPPDPSVDVRAAVAAVLDAARAVVRRAGAARVDEITGQVGAESAAWVDDGLVTDVVSQSADFTWLEHETGWFSLSSVARNAVASRVAKILSVSGSVSLSDLHEGICRDERMREFAVPERILAELCARLPGVSVREDVVVADAPPPPEEVLERTELTLVRALQAAGGEASRSDLERVCIAAGVTRSSINNRLAYSPLIVDLGQRRYGLRGAGSGEGVGQGGAWGGAEATPESTPPRPDDLATFRPPPRR